MKTNQSWMLVYGLCVVVLIFTGFFVLRASGVGYEYEWYRNELEQMQTTPQNEMSDYDQMIYDANLRGSNPSVFGQFTLDVGFESHPYIQILEKIVLVLLFALPLISFKYEGTRHAVVKAFLLAFVVGLMSYNARVMHWYGGYDEMDFIPVFVYGVALAGLLLEFVVLFFACRARVAK